MWKAYRYTGTRTGALEPLEHIREIVLDRRVYFPRPSQLNDPIDCRPRMIRPTSAEINVYLLRKGNLKYPGQNLREERKRRRMHAHRRLEKPDTLQRLWAEQAERYGILSLSRSKCNAHMWNAYAETGRGVCIEFDFEPVIEGRAIDWVPFAVEYADHQPELNILKFQRPDKELVREFACRSFRTKTREWMVEEEVRVTTLIERDPPKLLAPDGMLGGLFLGPHMSKDHREKILSWQSDLPVHATRLDDDGTIVGFERLR
jgi:hypothetical protein